MFMLPTLPIFSDNSMRIAKHDIMLCLSISEPLLLRASRFLHFALAGKSVRLDRPVFAAQWSLGQAQRDEIEAVVRQSVVVKTPSSTAFPK